MKQQTAVEWIEDSIQLDMTIMEVLGLIRQAKEMEKEQIMDAWLDGDNSDCLSEQDSSDFAERYYNKTYGGNK